MLIYHRTYMAEGSVKQVVSYTPRVSFIYAARRRLPIPVLTELGVKQLRSSRPTLYTNLPLIPRLHDRANIEQTSSKHRANIKRISSRPDGTPPPGSNV